ncbi:MAG: hypothetical protein ACYDD1_01090, partial [Caulobacteraceae bacterium]
MDIPTRAEKMVGELIGLRLLVAQLLENEAVRSGDPAATETTRGKTLARLADWPIGADTPEGAERIRSCATTMLTVFPAPT